MVLLINTKGSFVQSHNPDINFTGSVTGPHMDGLVISSLKICQALLSLSKKYL